MPANILKAPQDAGGGGCSLPGISGGEWLRRKPDGAEGLSENMLQQWIGMLTNKAG